MAEIKHGVSMDSRSASALIGESPRLRGLKDNTWQAVLADSLVLHYRAGSKLISHRSPVDRILIVLKGRIKVCETASNGREVTLYRVSDGQICALSLARMLHGHSQCAEAVVEEDVRLLAVPRELFARLVAESAGFRDYLLTALAEHLTELMQLTAEVSFNKLDQRLAALIRRLSADGTAAGLRLTHQEIANELGTTREVISRLLKDFEKAGYLKLGRGRIQVLALDKLDGLCNPASQQRQLGL